MLTPPKFFLLSTAKDPIKASTPVLLAMVGEMVSLPVLQHRQSHITLRNHQRLPLLTVRPAAGVRFASLLPLNASRLRGRNRFPMVELLAPLVGSDPRQARLILPPLQKVLVAKVEAMMGIRLLLVARIAIPPIHHCGDEILKASLSAMHAACSM